MTTLDQIQNYANRIAEEFHPERIILFGSYADGRPNPDSDVDLMVVMPFRGKWYYQAVEIQMKIRPPFPLDLLVRTPERIQERLGLGDPFIRRIISSGKVLYESHSQ
jgi:predicted nucleotidyltransferase